MFLLNLLTLALLCSLVDCFFIGNISFGPTGAKFTRLKKEAEEEFLRQIGLKSFLDYVDRDWLSLWHPTGKIEKLFSQTEFKPKELDWWNSVHNYIPPKKKPRRRRRRGRGKRDTFQKILTQQEDAILSRQKRQECGDIPTPPTLIRREWRQMTAAGRTSFINAFNTMASTIVPPSLTQHNLFVVQHRSANAPSAHNGAGFLSWHREFLWRLSNTLRQHGYNGAIPYWDSLVDTNLPNPADSAIWTDTHFGQSTGLVNQPWNTIEAISECELQGSGNLRRNMKTGSEAQALMMDRNTVQEILNLPCFQDLTKGWNPLFEESHERMLLLMGTPNTAQMADANCAPTDPVYWLHTAFMDLIWERYRMDRQDFAVREIEYPLENLAGPGGNPARHRWRRVMRPFLGLINIHGLSNHYTSYYYTYSEPPSQVSCTNHGDCGGNMLWCLDGLCMGKIREGGQCDSTWNNVQCHCPTGNPQCNSGLLVCEC